MEDFPLTREEATHYMHLLQVGLPNDWTIGMHKRVDWPGAFYHVAVRRNDWPDSEALKTAGAIYAFIYDLALLGQRPTPIEPVARVEAKKE